MLEQAPVLIVLATYTAWGTWAGCRALIESYRDRRDEAA